MKKIKILYIVSSLKKCGPIIVLKNIIEGLDLKRFEINILTLKNSKEENYEKYLQNMGVKIYNLNSTKYLGLFKGIIFLYKNGKKFDVIHSHSERADFLNYLFKTKKYKVSTLHNYPLEDIIMSYGKIKGLFLVNLYEKFLKSFDYIACGQELSHKIFEKYKLKIPFINNGVDLSEFCEKNNEEKIKIREKLKLNQNKKYYIVASSIIKRKNIEIILKAFSKNKKCLLILGDGILLKEYEERYKKNSNICFLGRVNNVKEYLQASDCYISMSLSEGLPNSVLEALGVGLPVILSDIPQHVQIIKNTENFLVKVNDENNLIDCLDKVDFSLEMKKRNIELIKLNYSKEIMSRSYSLLYEKKAMI